MSGDEGIYPAWYPTTAGSPRSIAETAGLACRQLIGVRRSDPIHQLVHGRVLWSTGDRLRKNHGGDDGRETALDEIAEHPTEFPVRHGLIKDARAEDDDAVHDAVHGAARDAARSRAERRSAALRAAGGVGSDASSSSR